MWFVLIFCFSLLFYRAYWRGIMALCIDVFCIVLMLYLLKIFVILLEHWYALTFIDSNLTKNVSVWFAIYPFVIPFAHKEKNTLIELADKIMHMFRWHIVKYNEVLHAKCFSECEFKAISAKCAKICATRMCNRHQLYFHISPPKSTKCV